MLILVVDNEEYRHELFKSKYLVGHEVWHAFNTKRAIYLLAKMKFDVMYLEFDLEEENTLPIIDFLEEEGNKPNNIIVHSFNEDGAGLIMDKILPFRGKWKDVTVIRSIFGPNMFLPDRLPPR